MYLIFNNSFGTIFGQFWATFTFGGAIRSIAWSGKNLRDGGRSVGELLDKLVKQDKKTLSTAMRILVSKPSA